MVKPLFKKGDKSKVSNYRPISTLSSFSKVLEKVMYKQLQDHLNKYSILAQEQFGFRSDSTTNKAIYKLINEILNALNSKLVVGGTFFDLEKAFYCLNHILL
jgi:F0F1-type ATP synthase alpha subunit